jgi:hypothetical protein
MGTEQIQPSLAASARSLPFVGHRSPFIRRTVGATLLTLALVALNVAVYKSPMWAGWYLGAGLWALGFFALTPLIVKTLVFEGRAGAGLGLIALKLAWMGLLLGVCVAGGSADAARLQYSALIAGVTTPLAVVTLRALGSLAMQSTSRTAAARQSTAVETQS